MRITDQDRLAWGAALADRLAPIGSLHPIVKERSDKQTRVTEGLAAAQERIGRETTEEGAALAKLTAASEDAARTLRLVALKLETAHLEGAIEDEAFRAFMSAAFPHGTGAVGSTPGDRYQAVKRASEAFGAHAGVDTSDSLAAKASAALDALETANADAKREAIEKQEANEALALARAAWDDAWIATKEIVSGLLRDAGRREELPSFFPDGAAK